MRSEISSVNLTATPAGRRPSATSRTCHHTTRRAVPLLIAAFALIVASLSLAARPALAQQSVDGDKQVGGSGAGHKGGPGPQWVTPEVKAPMVSFHTFDSAAAKTKVSYHLYTPAAYNAAENKDRRLPVVYWLHGSGGGAAGIAKVAAHVDAAIEAGKTPPCFVVFVNGLVEGMYVDWKDGTAPLETVIVKDLVPHIDAAYRTIATREGRMLDGFSMGGYGSARLGFKYPEMFRSVSIVGAGPMQAELIQAPRAGRKRAAEVLAKVYGGDQAYFRRTSPRVLAEQNAEAITKGSLVRLVIGDKDETFAANKEFHEHLERLKVPHTWTVLPGIAHDPMGVLSAMGDDNWMFYRAAFAQDGLATAPPRAPEPATSDKEIGWEAIVETNTLTIVATGCRFTEGPLWRADGTLLFSDIPANTVYVIRPDAANSTPQEFRKPSGNTNGNTFDLRGRILSANHDGTLTRHEPSGETTVLASKFESKRLNSPNDVVVRSDGKIYFTDPTYGVKKEDRQLDFSGVYRLDLDSPDASSGKLSVLTKEFTLPNGLTLSPDEKKLYVGDYGARIIKVYDVAADGGVSEGRLFADFSQMEGNEGPDGMKCDTLGNLWTTGPGGVLVFSPAGELLGRLKVPGGTTNVAFGEKDGRTLFVTAGDKVFSVRTKMEGIVPAHQRPMPAPK
jgi:gluconolactonase